MISMITVTDTTPVAMLTVGQQKELFQGWIKELLGKEDVPTQSKDEQTRYVYGVAGIARLFNVSYVTALKLKNGILKPAVFQQGRKIICDADMAIKLFRNQQDITT